MREERKLKKASELQTLARSYLFPRNGVYVADDLEKAISLYKECLQTFTKNSYPIRWALTTYYLAYAYTDRIRGSQSDNIEKAIQLYKDCLLIYTKNTYPTDWADATHGLALAYRCHFEGTKAENVEKAIALYEQALLVSTRRSYPSVWATTTYWLAEDYSKRIQGSQADNNAKAIQYYEQVLSYYRHSSRAVTIKNRIASLRRRSHQLSSQAKAVCSFTDVRNVSVHSLQFICRSNIRSIGTHSIRVAVKDLALTMTESTPY